MPASTSIPHKALTISKAQRNRRTTTCTPNILPCRIHHDGPVNASSRHWKPIREADGTQTTYFRGRKLRGRTIRVPDDYRGAILKKTDQIVRLPEQGSPTCSNPEDMDDADEMEECLKMEDVAEFDEVVVWGHEACPEDLDNPYVRGIEEWISFANALHSNSDSIDQEATE